MSPPGSAPDGDSKESRGLVRWVRESRRDEFFWLRVVGGSTAIALAVLAVVTDGVHDSFLILAGIAAVVLAFPWHRLSALRAGPFEFSLEQGQIKAAVSSIEIGGEAEGRVKDLLSRLRADIERARGGRVLWVDDDPLRVLPERRLFRALDIETVSVPFSRDAAATLRRDNDFDLVITSFYKATEEKAVRKEFKVEKELKEAESQNEHRKRDQIPLADRFEADDRKLGVLFVQWLRGNNDGDELIKGIYDGDVTDRVINNLPVLFYVAATKMAELREGTLPVVKIEPSVELSVEVEDFFAKAIRMLADARSYPISVSATKGVPGAGASPR